MVRYARGSKSLGMASGSCGTAIAVTPHTNLLSVEEKSGEPGSCDPRWLTGANICRELAYEFSAGDRIQLTSARQATRRSKPRSGGD